MNKEMKTDQFTRRNFIKKSVATSSLAAIGPIAFPFVPAGSEIPSCKLPREVWIAGISQTGLEDSSSRIMVDRIMGLIDDVAVFQPDIICLPETFESANQKFSLSEKLDNSQRALKLVAVLARKYNCYIICPVHISTGNYAYNAAVVFDRTGTRFGEYLKTHLTIGEIESGLTPGPVQPPVFQTDFGRIGIQICYDIYWNDGWEKLRRQNAEIVCWPSAFAAGQRLNIKAAEHHYIVASSTRNATSKICDIRGETVVQTGQWSRNFYCGTVNLEKILVDTWPHVNSFNEIQKKYGRKVRITTFHEEQWSVIESLVPDIFVADIVKEFGLKTFNQDVDDAETAQIKARQS
jgi:beta-ureidopropionase